MQAVVIKVLQSVLASILTEKVLINLIILLAERVVQSTENDLDNQILREFKDALDRNHGTPGNLYKSVKEKL